MMKSERSDDELFDMGVARREEIPLKNGRPVSPPTTWRWWTQGIAGVKLEVVHVGGAPFTSRRKLREFFAAVTKAKQEKRLAVEAPVSDAELREARLK